LAITAISNDAARGFPRAQCRMIQRWVETSGGRCHVEAVLRHGTKVQVFWPMRPVGAQP
jgi:hypothetical protein